MKHMMLPYYLRVVRMNNGPAQEDISHGTGGQWCSARCNGSNQNSVCSSASSGKFVSTLSTVGEWTC